MLVILSPVKTHAQTLCGFHIISAWENMPPFLYPQMHAWCVCIYIYIYIAVVVDINVLEITNQNKIEANRESLINDVILWIKFAFNYTMASMITRSSIPALEPEVATRTCLLPMRARITHPLTSRTAATLPLERDVTHCFSEIGSVFKWKDSTTATSL